MALYTKLTRQNILEILENYPELHGKKFSAKGIALGTVNTFYKLTFSPTQSFFLKIDEVGNVQRLKNELAIFDCLKSNSKNFDFTFPLPLKTFAGKDFCKWNQKLVLIFTELSGESIYPPKLTPTHMHKIGRLIAQWHLAKASKNIKAHRFDLAGQKKVFAEIKTKLLKKHPDVANKISKLLKNLSAAKSDSKNLKLIHADYFAENFMWQKNKLVGILDFDAAGLGEPGFDLGVAIHALCHSKTGFEVLKIKALIQGYQSVRNLTSHDKKQFPQNLDMSALRFLLTRLRDFELKDGPVKAKPFKDYREFLHRFEENVALKTLNFF